ncbi:MAG TPA: hypothetical protein PLN12_15030 [Flavobacteriales bacterium]|nr:hypothetical protein [Flavobacteriales bacterium]
MDTRKATDDALLPNCIPEEWKAAKVRDLKLKKGGSELYWISGKEDNKDLLLPRSLAQVEVPAIASELVKRWNAHDDLLNALKHVHETDAVNIDWKMVANTIKKYTHA